MHPKRNLRLCALYLAVSLSGKCNIILQIKTTKIYSITFTFFYCCKKKFPSCINMSQVLIKISTRFAIWIFSLTSLPLMDEFANYLFLSLLQSIYRDGSISLCQREKMFFLLILAYFLSFFGNRKENWHHLNFLQTLNTSSLKKEHLMRKKKNSYLL